MLQPSRLSSNEGCEGCAVIRLTPVEQALQHLLLAVARGQHLAHRLRHLPKGVVCAERRREVRGKLFLSSPLPQHTCAVQCVHHGGERRLLFKVRVFGALVRREHHHGVFLLAHKAARAPQRR